MARVDELTPLERCQRVGISANVLTERRRRESLSERTISNSRRQKTMADIHKVAAYAALVGVVLLYIMFDSHLNIPSTAGQPVLSK
jgi:hypothetical protein